MKRRTRRNTERTQNARQDITHTDLAHLPQQQLSLGGGRQLKTDTNFSPAHHNNIISVAVVLQFAVSAVRFFVSAHPAAVQLRVQCH